MSHLDFDFELESDHYWDVVENVLRWPFAFASNWSRPMFEII